MVFALDKIIMAFTNVLWVYVNISKNLKNFRKVLQGRWKYPALKPLKSESDQLLSSLNLNLPQTHKASPQPTWGE